MTTIEFNKHVSKIESLLIGFSMKLTRNRDNAKDLMQETLMRCFDKRDRFQEGTNFKSWATTIMYNSYINHYRKRKFRSSIVRPMEDVEYMIETKNDKNNVHDIKMTEELIGIVDGLSDSYKIPFKIYVKGYQYDEIAEQLDIPMGTVKSRIFYARKKLKNVVGERYDVSTVMAA